MVKTSFGSYEQFRDFFGKAPKQVQNILFKAYPEWARRLTEEYIATTKKISASKVGQEIAKDINKVKGATPKQIGMVKDTAKAASTATKAASTTGKLAKVGGLASRIAPIQGAVNLFSRDSDVWDRLAGAGMIGTGVATMAGATAAAPWAAALVGGDLAKKTIAKPLGEKWAEFRYGKEPDVSNIYSGLADVDMPDPMMKSFTPEQEAKLRAYNKGVIDRTLAEADTSLARGNEEIKAWDNMINGNQDTVNQIENDVRGGSYPVSQSGYGVYPQNSQNAQEGGLNIIQDNLYSEPYKPSLKPIVEPVNYSNEYLASQNNLINQLYKNANQGEEKQMSMNNPYDLGGLRPYAQIDNQPQGLDYGAILNQFNDAMKADQRQNQINQMVNAFGVFGTPARRAPIYFIDHKGKMQAIELDQPSEMAPLPTNTTSNYDKLMGQLKIQEAQQADTLARQKQAAADLKAQQEYIANQNMMNALGQHLNVDPNMFANPDIAKAALQYVFNPDIQSRANVQETIGKAPTQAMLKAAEQRGETAGKLDEVQLGKQFDAMIANINNNAKLEATAMEQGGMDRRLAAQIAAQRAMNAYTQIMQNFRDFGGYSNPREKIEAQQKFEYNKLMDYANVMKPQSKASEYDEQAAMDKDWNTLIGNGTPIPQAIKYMQVKYPNFGLTDKERAELKRQGI